MPKNENVLAKFIAKQQRCGVVGGADLSEVDERIAADRSGTSACVARNNWGRNKFFSVDQGLRQLLSTSELRRKEKRSCVEMKKCG